MTTICRCLSWVAVSSQAQGERESPADQRRENARLVNELGRYYPGYSGVLVTTLELHASRSMTLDEALDAYPEYVQMVQLIKGRSIDAVVCRSRDRLGRTSALITTLERICADNNVVIVPRMSLPTTIDPRRERSSESGPLMSAVEASMAEIEVRRLVNRHEMGMRGRAVRRGLFPNRPPFGYRYVYSKDGQQSVEVDPVAARTVRTLLVELYLRGGMGVERVAEELNRRGMRTPTGKLWRRRRVAEVIGRIDAYAGFVVLNRTSSRREVIRVRGVQEAIITADEYQMLFDERAARSHAQGARTHIYSGVVVCAVCGHSMSGYNKKTIYTKKTTGETVVYEGRYVRCSGSPDHRHTLEISVNVVDRAVRATISRLQEMADLSDLVDQANESRREVLDEQMATLRQVIANLSAQRNRVTDLYVAHGIMRLDEYMTRIEDIDRQIADAEAELAEVERVAVTVDFEEDREKRIERLRNSGIELLDQAKEMPGLVRQWLRETMIIYADRHPTQKNRAAVTRIEFR